jgi:hypothetical protein
MQLINSRIVNAIACLSVVLAVLGTIPWAFIVIHRDAMYRFGFDLFVAPVVGGVALLAFIPSVILYGLYREKRDWWSFVLSLASGLAILVETAILENIPMSGGC